MEKQQPHGKHKSEITDAVHHKRLACRIVVGHVFVPESDEHKRAETHTFPTGKHEQIGVAQYQHQHKEHEQIEVGHKPVESFVIVHIANAVHVDEESDTGDKQQVNGTERIKDKADAHVQVSGHDPVKQVDLGSRTMELGGKYQHRNNKSAEYRAGGYPSNQLFGESFPEEHDIQETGEREQRNKRDEILHHRFTILIC